MLVKFASVYGVLPLALSLYLSARNGLALLLAVRPLASLMDNVPTAMRDDCTVGRSSLPPAVLLGKRMPGPIVICVLVPPDALPLPSSFMPDAQVGSTPVSNAAALRVAEVTSRVALFEEAPVANRGLSRRPWGAG